VTARTSVRPDYQDHLSFRRLGDSEAGEVSEFKDDHGRVIEYRLPMRLCLQFIRLHAPDIPNTNPDKDEVWC
jgi:hypothetical protein